jgi:hypothetical protein
LSAPLVTHIKIPFRASGVAKRYISLDRKLIGVNPVPELLIRNTPRANTRIEDPTIATRISLKSNLVCCKATNMKMRFKKTSKKLT